MKWLKKLFAPIEAVKNPSPEVEVKHERYPIPPSIIVRPFVGQCGDDYVSVSDSGYAACDEGRWVSIFIVHKRINGVRTDIMAASDKEAWEAIELALELRKKAARLEAHQAKLVDMLSYPEKSNG